MNETSHPDIARLGAFMAGNLSSAESQQVEQHIDGCEACRTQLVDIDDTNVDFLAEFQDAIQAPRRPPSTSDTVNGKANGQVGLYRLIKKIGEGGMGEVWMAAQDHPIRRQVAIKLTKADVSSNEIIARFEAERQALAMMQHQNIAKVLDAGTADTGAPYFVMELVDGIPLLQYCDERNLPVRERLELFLPVCNAVQHAHQKGIIHRDLKPSNVLVAMIDGQAVPKVIDFGLAKPLDNSLRLTDKTLCTELGKVVGTLNYMSPEQAELNNLDVDTRSDVYSLGVMLYELLTGSTPVCENTVQESGLLKVLAIIRDSEPPAPSQRIDSSDSVETVCSNRNEVPNRLRKLLAGELDWVVMKALEKDRNRRYQSVSSLAADIGRYLNNEPVVARPATRSYQLKKFVSRNRGIVTSVISLVALLFAGVIVSSYFAFRSSQSAAEARLSAKRSNDILAIVSRSFRSPNPENGSAPDMLAKDVLKIARQTLGDYDLGIEGKSKLLDSLAHAYSGIGEFESSTLIRKEILELSIQELGHDHANTLQKLNNLAVGYCQTGRIDEAKKILEATIPKLTEIHGADFVETLGAKQNLANIYLVENRFEEALELQKDALNRMERKMGPAHRTVLQLKANIANSLAQLNRVDEAMKLRTETLDLMSETLGNFHVDTLNARNNLAVGLLQAGKPKESRILLAQVVNEMKEHLGPAHPDTLNAMNMLTQLYFNNGQLESAMGLSNAVLKVYTENLEEDHPSVKRTVATIERIQELMNRERK